MSGSSFLNQLEIPKDFVKVPLILIGLNLQAWVAGLQVGKLRKVMFNKQFMEKHYGEIHKNELKEEIQLGGYPDTGNGLYAQKLSYSDWYKFNIHQRVHMNYIEGISLASTGVIAAGLVKGDYALGVGLAYMIGRFIYSFFHKKEKGALNPGRIAGIALCYLATLTGISLFLWKYVNFGFN